MNEGSLTTFGIGVSMSWTSPALPYLNEKANIPLSKAESYWIAPFLTLGCIVGFLVNPIIIDCIGTKKSLLLYSIPQILSWVLIVLSENYIVIYVGRLLGGIGYGAGCCALTVYLSEIGNRENRGIFLVLYKLSLCIGNFFLMLLGAYYSYSFMNRILLMIPVIFYIIFLFMPDSQYFLEKNVKSEKEKQLNCVNEIELRLIEEVKMNLGENDKLKESQLKKECEVNYETQPEETKLHKLFLLPHNRKALIIITCFLIQNTFSGNAITKVFAQKILTFNESPLLPEKAAFLFAGISIINSLVSVLTIEKFKRKSLFLFCGILASLSNIMIGLFFFLKYYNFRVVYFNWIPIISLVFYDFSIINGCINMYLIYQGELFESDVKSVAITYVKIVLMVLLFLAVMTFQILYEFLNIFVIFWIFGFCCVFMTWIIYKITPETKGKSIDEIKLLLTSRRR